jgi:hypothetical protein
MVLNWADGGRSSRQAAVTTPDDEEAEAVPGRRPAAAEDLAERRVQPVAAASTELASGPDRLFEAFNALSAGGGHHAYLRERQLHDGLKRALLMGATVIRQETWEDPADLRPKLLEAAQRAGAKLQAEIRRSGDADVAAMKASKTGLVVVPVDAKTKELWRKTAEATYPSIRGTIVPADAFDEALKYRDEYRKQKAAAKL